MALIDAEIAHRLKHLEKQHAPSSDAALLAIVRNALGGLNIEVVSASRLSHRHYLAYWRPDRGEALLQQTPFAMLEPDWFG